MNIRTLGRSIKEGVRGIARNRMFSLASIGTITACLFIFGLFFFVIVNFESSVNKAESSVGITVFFTDDATSEQKTAIGDKIRARREVSEVDYISAAQAWAKYKKESLNPELAETFGEDNPLDKSDSYTVFLNDVSRQEGLVNYILTLDGVRKVNGSQTEARGLASFNSLIGLVGGSIMVILLAVAIFLISTTISMGISVRREEINIMKLIGATDFFIRAPFLIEGVIIGLAGALIPLLLLRVLYIRAIEAIQTRFAVLSNILIFLPVNEVFKELIPLSLVIGVGIGLAGSYITVHRQLRL